MIHPEIETLYKYRRFDTNSIELIVDNKIWVSGLSNFNDPLEIHFAVKNDADLGRVRKYDPENQVTKDLESLREDILHNLSHKLVLGVFCLSARNDIALMLSHYTDGHKGFCIGYERSETNSLGKCTPVSYESIPTLKLSDIYAHSQGNQRATDTLCHDLIYNKDPNWKYEREWRMGFTEQNTLQELDAPIRSITFGYKMVLSRRKIIQQLLTDKQTIKYFEAIPSKNSYNIEIIPFD